MRILIVTGIFPPDIGGPATYVPQIAKGLAERGHRITVLTLSGESVESMEGGRGEGEGDSPGSGYPFRVVRIPRGIFKPWRWLRTVFTTIRLGRSADILFVNGLAMESVLANLLLRKPMVQKVVGDLAWERATGKGWTTADFESFQSTSQEPQATGHALRIKALKSVRSWWTRRANKIIVPSRYLAKWVVDGECPRTGSSSSTMR